MKLQHILPILLPTNMTSISNEDLPRFPTDDINSPVQIDKGDQNDSIVNPICEQTQFNDIDFLEAVDSSDEAVKLLRFCEIIHKYDCDLRGIAGEENWERAELLESTANCGLEVQGLVVYCLTLTLCIVTILANLIELILIYRYKKLRNSTNRMIVSLAFSDLLFGASAVYTTIMNILTAKANLEYNSQGLKDLFQVRSKMALCLLLDGPGFMFGCMMASIFTLTAIAVEKYIAIFHPLKYYQWITNKTICIILIFIWLVSILFGFMPLMGWNNFQGSCFFVEKTSSSFLITWASICLLCAIGTFVLYFKIFLTARKHARQIAQRQVSYPVADISGSLGPVRIDSDPISNVRNVKSRSTGTVEPLTCVNTTAADASWEGKLNRKYSKGRLPVLRNSTGSMKSRKVQPMCTFPSYQKKFNKTIDIQMPESTSNHRHCLSSQVSDLHERVAGIPEEITVEVHSPTTPHRKEPIQVLPSAYTETVQPSTSREYFSESQTGTSGTTNSTSISDNTTRDASDNGEKITVDRSAEQKPQRSSLTSKISFRNLRLKSNFSVSKVQVFSPPGVKAVKTLAIILGTFYMCWLPLICYLISQMDRYSNFTIYVLSFIAMINGLLNPLVYGFHSQSLRTAFKKFFQGSDWTTSNAKKTTDHHNTNDGPTVYERHI